MQLTEKQITEFQRIYEKEFGVKMNREEAVESASNLIRYFEIALPIAYRQKTQDEKRLNRKN